MVLVNLNVRPLQICTLFLFLFVRLMISKLRKGGLSDGNGIRHVWNGIELVTDMSGIEY